jgi:hypothetical protein
MRYIAHFTPEVWVNDYAIEAAPQGPQEWDCTALATSPDGDAYLARLVDGGLGDLSDPYGVLDNDDWFSDDPAAPEWVRNWQGPFTIRIREAG